MKYSFNKVKQVNIFEKDGQANYHADFNSEKFRDEIGKLIPYCSKSEKIILNEALNSLNKKDESGLKSALKKLVDTGSKIFTKVSADILVAYMRSQNIIP